MATVAASAQKITKPMTKCMAGPAPITTVRFQAGNRHMARGWSASSSCGVMPVILTKPPTGMALTPYSIPPRRTDHRVGPNPAKNRVTRMPSSLAAVMWPTSCSRIDTRMARAPRVMPMAVDIWHVLSCCRRRAVAAGPQPPARGRGSA